MNSYFNRSYNIEKTEIKGIFNNKQIAWMENIELQISREQQPIYTMGNPPKRPKFPKIAGSLRFFQFDAEPFVYEDVNSLRIQGNKALPWYPDQIPAFDIILAELDENNVVNYMKILEVELLNNGYGVSIDDIVSKQDYQFIAQGIRPWAPVVDGKLPSFIDTEDSNSYKKNHEGQIYNPYTNTWSWL